VESKNQHGGEETNLGALELLTNLVIKIKNKVVERASMVRKKKKQRTRVVIQQKM